VTTSAYLKSLRAAFDFRSLNPTAYNAMGNRAVMLRRLGKYVSSKSLAEWARVEMPISYSLDDFKINNSLTPSLARIMERDWPELQGAFHRRHAACDQDQILFEVLYEEKGAWSKKG
jgi:hypothetical protein